MKNNFEFFKIQDSEIYFAINLTQKLYIRVLLFTEECSISHVFNERKVRDKYNNCKVNCEEISSEKFIEVLRKTNDIGNNLPFVLAGQQNREDLHPIKKLDGHMNTLSCVRFNLLEPKPEMIIIDDIAAGLAHNGHFNGQSDEMFTIAQHSMEVYTRAKTAFNNPVFSLVALLHDAAEAYTGDIIKPIKVMWSGFDALEKPILKAIFKKFNLPFGALKIIKPIDDRVQELEYDQFYNCRTHFPYLTPPEAKKLFLETLDSALQEFHEFIHNNPEYRDVFNLEKSTSD